MYVTQTCSLRDVIRLYFLFLGVLYVGMRGQ